MLTAIIVEDECLIREELASPALPQVAKGW